MQQSWLKDYNLIEKVFTVDSNVNSRTALYIPPRHVSSLSLTELRSTKNWSSVKLFSLQRLSTLRSVGKKLWNTMLLACRFSCYSPRPSRQQRLGLVWPRHNLTLNIIQQKGQPSCSLLINNNNNNNNQCLILLSISLIVELCVIVHWHTKK